MEMNKRKEEISRAREIVYEEWQGMSEKWITLQLKKERYRLRTETDILLKEISEYTKATQHTRNRLIPFDKEIKSIPIPGLGIPPILDIEIIRIDNWLLTLCIYFSDLDRKYLRDDTTFIKSMLDQTQTHMKKFIYDNPIESNK